MPRTSAGEAFSGAFLSLSHSLTQHSRPSSLEKKYMLTCDYLADNLMVDFHHHAAL